MAETPEQSIENTAQIIFDAVDKHGPAMQQRLIYDALRDLYIVAQTNA